MSDDLQMASAMRFAASLKSSAGDSCSLLNLISDFWHSIKALKNSLQANLAIIDDLCMAPWRHVTKEAFIFEEV